METDNDKDARLVVIKASAATARPKLSLAHRELGLPMLFRVPSLRDNGRRMPSPRKRRNP